MSDVPPPRRPAPTPRTYARTHLHRPPPFIERHHPSFTRVHRHPRPSSTSPVAWSCVRFKRPTRACARALTVHALVCVTLAVMVVAAAVILIHPWCVCRPRCRTLAPVPRSSSSSSYARASCVVRRCSGTPNVRTLGTDAECPNIGDRRRMSEHSTARHLTSACAGTNTHAERHSHSTRQGVIACDECTPRRR